MQPLDVIQLVEQRLAALEARLQQSDLRLSEEARKAVSIVKVDLLFSLAKARYILELMIQDIYQWGLPREKPKPQFVQHCPDPCPFLERVLITFGLSDWFNSPRPSYR